MSARVSIKKYLFKLRYLEEEYHECKEIHDEARVEFESQIRKTHYNLNVFDKDLDWDRDTPVLKEKKSSTQEEKDKQKNKSRKEDPEMLDFSKNPDTNHPQWAKKVFRKIATLTHPDKIPKNLDKDIKEKFNSAYILSKPALEIGDYVKLIMIASDLGIDISSIKIDNFDKFKNKEASLQKDITSIKSSVFWAWAHSTEPQKKEIIKEFLKSRGWTSAASQRKKSRKGSGIHPGKSIAWARGMTADEKKKD